MGFLNVDEVVKSRHSGEHRSPENYNYLKRLDSGFRRNDRKAYFKTFYETINGELSPFFRLHLFFAADDVTSIHAPTDFIYCNCQTTNAAFVNISLFYTLWSHFFYWFLNGHGFLLSLLVLLLECSNRRPVTLLSQPKLADFMTDSST